MNERDTKPELPIHVILGASDYKNFEQQLERNEGGWYETGLVQTENKVPLNKTNLGASDA